jgi:predicted HD phosphohydrolase
MEQVKFTEMKYGDVEDYTFLHGEEMKYVAGTGERLLEALLALGESMGGYQVSRLEHSVQSATRAWRGGADIDWTVAALLHDIGDPIAPYNHDEYAALVLRPFVREQCAWTVEVHGDFQKIYYADKIGGNPNSREQHAGNQYYDDCVEFCALWDQASFDPNYDTLPLEFFRPMVLEVFARDAHDPAVIRAGAREPLTSNVNRTAA